MKNAIYLDSDFVREEMDSVNVLLRRFETLINSTDGVLTGQMIWRNIVHALDINTKQEIIDAFGLFSLDDKIYDIKSVVLYKDMTHTYCSMYVMTMKKISTIVKLLSHLQRSTQGLMNFRRRQMSK